MKCSPDRVQMVQNRLTLIISFVMKLFETVQNGIRQNQAKWSPIMTHIMLIIPKPIRLQLLSHACPADLTTRGRYIYCSPKHSFDFALAKRAPHPINFAVVWFRTRAFTFRSKGFFVNYHYAILTYHYFFYFSVLAVYVQHPVSRRTVWFQIIRRHGGREPLYIRA